jgi:hypothetical protein
MPAHSDAAPAISPSSRPDDAAAATVLSWRIHRLTEDPRRLPVIAAAYAAAFTLWRLVFPHPLALLLPAVSLTCALAEYLFPVTYRLTTHGAHADCGPARLFIAWDDVKRATAGRDGVYLSPFARRVPSLESFRGVRLRFAPGQDREVVLEAVRLCRRDEAAA